MNGRLSALFSGNGCQTCVLLHEKNPAVKWTRLVWILNIAALLAAGFLIVGMVQKRDDVESASPVDSNLSHVSPVRAVPALTEEDRVEIVSRNIFLPDGASGRDSTSNDTGASLLARTRLQVRLLGTIAGDAEIARAVIEDMTSKVQDIYKVGDSVQGAEVRHIARNRVILLVDGKSEVLELYLTASGAPADARSSTPGPAIDIDLSKAVSVISPTQFEINKKALLAQIGGVEAVVKAAKLTPYVVDGKTEGLRITGLDNISMARFVGIQNEDVIQVVNGQTLTSRQKAYQVMRKARTQGNLNVQLLRDGEEKALTFGIK